MLVYVTFSVRKTSVIGTIVDLVMQMVQHIILVILIVRIRQVYGHHNVLDCVGNSF